MVSKAFESLLRRSLNNSTSIKQLARTCPKDYPELIREKGVSFNPLAARLVDISLKMGLSESEIEELLIATRSSSFSNFDSIKKLPSHMASVWAVDALRHFRMAKLDNMRAKEIFALATSDHPMVTKAKAQYEKIFL